MFDLKIETGNAAFADDPGELARILRELADKLDGRFDPDAGISGGLRDANGNTVGQWRNEP